MKIIKLSFVFIFFTLQLYAQKEKVSGIDKLFTKLEQGNNFSGYLLIAENGKVIFDKGFGFTDKEKNIKPSCISQFNLSSAAKIFAGTAIVKLAQDGKLLFTDTIGKYIPGLVYGSSVTLHHLLTHSSGLTEFYFHPGFSYTNIKSCMDIIPFIKEQQPVFTPGDSVKYSTTGMILLGAVIEQISKISFPEYIRKNILKPLKMTNTSFVNYEYVQELQDETGKYAKGYVKDSTNKILKRKKESYNFVPLSAGGIWSSACDLYKFDQAVYKSTFLKDEYRKLMLEPKVYTGWPNCYFGYVWMNINQNKDLNHAVGHAGNASAHHAYYYRYDKNNTVVILLTNYGFVDIFNLSEQIEKIIFPN
jgi:CubicO group peptidase (beta-lactamase class C family)